RADDLAQARVVADRCGTLCQSSACKPRATVYSDRFGINVVVRQELQGYSRDLLRRTQATRERHVVGELTFDGLRPPATSAHRRADAPGGNGVDPYADRGKIARDWKRHRTHACR